MSSNASLEHDRECVADTMGVRATSVPVTATRLGSVGPRLTCEWFPVRTNQNHIAVAAVHHVYDHCDAANPRGETRT